MSSNGGNGGSGIGIADPTTFREAEVIGLRFMQEGRHEDALKAFKMAMKLPGSRPDVVRTKMLSGPSPVGGAQGGTEGKIVMNLDEFEAQVRSFASLPKISVEHYHLILRDILLIVIVLGKIHTQ